MIITAKQFDEFWNTHGQYLRIKNADRFKYFRYTLKSIYLYKSKRRYDETDDIPW